MANQDATIISGICDMTELATNDEIPFLRDNATPEEIFNSICDELRQVCKEVKSAIAKNVPTNETGINAEKTVIMPEITTTLRQKASVINKLTNNLKDSNELDFPRFKNEGIMSLPVMMAEETSSCVKAVETLDRLKKENDDYLRLLSETDEFLAAMEKTEPDVQRSDSELDKIHKMAKKELKELQEDLSHVIEVLFEDEETSGRMYGLLEELVKKSQSSREDDEWYEISEKEMMPLIMMLCQTGALLVNSQNNKLVKLII